MHFEGIMLSEFSQTKINTSWYHSYVESKKKSNSQKQSRMVVVRGWAGGNREGLVKGYTLLVIR